MKKIINITKTIAVSICLFVAANGFCTRTHAGANGWSLRPNENVADVRWCGPILITQFVAQPAAARCSVCNNDCSQKTGEVVEGWGIRFNKNNYGTDWKGCMLFTRLP